jgi:diguanylate cyclase (GGDEF)-like protein
LRASLPRDLPWIRTLMIAGGDGRIQCSTNAAYVGLDLSDRPYFQQAHAGRDFVFSDFLLSMAFPTPIIMAAYPASAINSDVRAVMLASINLDWISKVMNNFAGRPGITAALIDGKGVALAAPEDQRGIIGRPAREIPLLSDVAEKALGSDEEEGSLTSVAADGTRLTTGFVRIAGTNVRLITSIDEDKVTATINRDIRNAYLQLALVCLLVLIGALIAAEKVIIEPIEMLAAMAKRLGQGDLSARAVRSRLPSKFVPLARAFNAMAAKLSQRERELVATNDRLTVIASMDMVSGLANRRGFQSRLDFEWMKAQQHDGELSLLMIDVDYFKLYNDTYGHPEGDACLARLGETLANIASGAMGFAARYGGEEFCLLLPDTGAGRAREIGETVRSAVLDLAMPHRTSSHQSVTVSVGVASARPNENQLSAELVEAADAALYAAKHRGRNVVVAHGFSPIEDGASGIAMAC